MSSKQRFVVRALIAAFALSIAPMALAQERHVVDRSAMQSAVISKLASEAADRAAILTALHRPEAKTVAGQLGLDLTRMDDAVATMTPSELAQLATPAREVNSDPAGGDVVVISVTVLLLLLILIVLIVK